MSLVGGIPLNTSKSSVCMRHFQSLCTRILLDTRHPLRRQLAPVPPAFLSIISVLALPPTKALLYFILFGSFYILYSIFKIVSLS